MPHKKKSKAKISSKKSLADVIKVVEKTNRYPLAGTVFVLENVPYIVESEENLSVLSDAATDVACYSLATGYTDISGWHELVRTDKVEIVWCPKNSSVKSMSNY